MFDDAETNPDTATAAFEWQQSRRRPDGHFDVPIRGFMGGKMTLWLPSSEANVRYIFKNGRPVREESNSCMASREIAMLRDQVICSYRGDGINEPVTTDLSFLEYVAAIVKVNYAVSDEDLTMLLDGTSWHSAMINHLCGGEQFLETVLRLAPVLAGAYPPSPTMPSADTSPPRRFAKLRRLLKLG